MQYRSKMLRLQDELGMVPEQSSKPDVQSLRDEMKRVKNENVRSTGLTMIFTIHNSEK